MHNSEALVTAAQGPEAACAIAMQIEANCRWIARRAGGLALGVRLHFPCTVFDDCLPGVCAWKTRRMTTISFSFIVFEITVYLFKIQTKELILT